MITRVGTTIVEATSTTIPAHKPGDFIICFAFRDGSTTNPSIGSSQNWTTITTTTEEIGRAHV